jgi:superfamily II DNA/RNA helicase
MFNMVFLDVDGIKFVINFDYPNSSEDYIHRIGRTGRCQMTGTSYAFFTPSNSRQARDLVAVLREANQVVNPKLDEMANRGGFGGRGDRKYGCEIIRVIKARRLRVSSTCSAHGKDEKCILNFSLKT